MGAVRIEYSYDAWGNRVETLTDLDGDGFGYANILRFALDGWNPAKPAPSGLENFDDWADIDDESDLLTRYLRGDKVDQLLGRVESDGTPYWTLTDHLGSVREVLDNSANVRDAIHYDVFGNLTETDEDFRGRYGWTGREIEAEVTLQFNRARFYDPTIARWIHKDPLGFDGGDSNLYRYVHNKSTIFSDPSGLDELTWNKVISNAETRGLPTAMLEIVAELNFKFKRGGVRTHAVDLVTRIVSIGEDVYDGLLAHGRYVRIDPIYNEAFSAFFEYGFLKNRSSSGRWMNTLIQRAQWEGEKYTAYPRKVSLQLELIDEAMSEMAAGLAFEGVFAGRIPPPNMAKDGFGAPAHNEYGGRFYGLVAASYPVPVYLRDLTLWIMQNGIRAPIGNLTGNEREDFPKLVLELRRNWDKTFGQHSKVIHVDFKDGSKSFGRGGYDDTADFIPGIRYKLCQPKILRNAIREEFFPCEFPVIANVTWRPLD